MSRPEMYGESFQKDDRSIGGEDPTAGLSHDELRDEWGDDLASAIEKRANEIANSNHRTRERAGRSVFTEHAVGDRPDAAADAAHSEREDKLLDAILDGDKREIARLKHGATSPGYTVPAADADADDIALDRILDGRSEGDNDDY